MKIFLFITLSLIVACAAMAQGLNRNGQTVSTESTYVNKNGSLGLTGIDKNGQFIVTAMSPGQPYQGGKIAYILVYGDTGYDSNVIHGLIADNADQSALWGVEGLAVPGADGTAIGTGLQNTIDIMAGDATSGSAARRCRGVTINGYSDWYLPSKDELNKLYINRTLIGGFDPAGWYFSSTEGNSATYAWYQSFADGSQAGTGAHKDWVLKIRAVRSF